jgi:uncharacterized membrane protein
LEGLVVIAFLAVLWMLVGPIVALVNARTANRNSHELLRRIEALEARLAGDLPPAGFADANVEEPTASAPPEALPAAEEALSEDIPASPSMSEAETAAVANRPAPPREKESLESKIGARWSVLVGGLALALGAIFLVRYSIEQGLIGPGMRIALGFLLSAILFGAGERLRRRDRALQLPIFARADIPAILTGAGGIAAFATIYAAHALYGFIGAGPAFVLMTAAGLATLFLSSIHGPSLAALGAIGSYAAPLLVSSTEPQPLPVVLHTLAVTAAVLGIARIRLWRWLALAGIGASVAWGVMIGLIGSPDTIAAQLLLLAGLTLIFLAALAYDTEPDTIRDRRPNLVALVGLAGIAVLSVLYILIDPEYPALVAAILIAGAIGAAASRWTSVAPAILIAGALAVATIMLLPVADAIGYGTMRFGLLEWLVLGEENLGRFALKAAALGLVVGLGSFLSADRAAADAPHTAGFFAAAGAAAPLAVLVVVYLRHVPFETRPAIGIAALAMAAIFAAMAERLIARRLWDAVAPAPALYASGAALALSFAFSVGLATRFIPTALSLGAAGIVWVGLYRPVKLLAWLAVLSAGLAAVAIVTGPPFTQAEIGTAPLFNGLILRLGLPALAVLFAGEILRRRQDGVPAGILQAIGLVFAALFVTLEIRHYANDGMIATGPAGLGEQSALTLAALAFSLGLQRIARRTRSKVYDMASLIAGVLGAAAIAIPHFFTANPLLTGEPVGEGRIFNLLLPGYLLPALAAAWVAAAARSVRPRWFVLGMAALALLLAFAHVTLSVRHSFHGSRLDLGPVLDAENWTYSAVWLVFGIALLAAGILLRSTMVRAASGLVIALVVFKVFLFDMAALTGALRAASFLGLGAVLIVIGRLYQRLLGRGGAPAIDAGTP